MKFQPFSGNMKTKMYTARIEVVTDFGSPDEKAGLRPDHSKWL